jgi:RNA recognition motif-containing protein
LADFFQIELVPKENKMSVKLYVGNLAYTTTEEELRTLFTQAGAVTSVALIKDRFTGDSKGFAFVEMESQADAQKAITQFDGSKLGDRDLKVNLARPREERGGFGGGGGGSYNRGGGGGGGRGNDRNRGGPRRY